MYSYYLHIYILHACMRKPWLHPPQLPSGEQQVEQLHGLLALQKLPLGALAALQHRARTLGFAKGQVARRPRAAAAVLQQQLAHLPLARERGGGQRRVLRGIQGIGVRESLEAFELDEHFLYR